MSADGGSVLDTAEAPPKLTCIFGNFHYYYYYYYQYYDYYYYYYYY